jgi:hypothetical protein
VPFEFSVMPFCILNINRYFGSRTKVGTMQLYVESYGSVKLRLGGALELLTAHNDMVMLN